MKITMLQTRPIVERGFGSTRRLYKGKNYDVADSAAIAEIKSGHAHETKEPWECMNQAFKQLFGDLK